MLYIDTISNYLTGIINLASNNKNLENSKLHNLKDIDEEQNKKKNYLDKFSGIDIFNLGTGNGFSVLELINTFESVTGKNIKMKISRRRKGDVSCCYADPSKANKILNWTAKRDLKNMCTTAWLHKLSQNNN